MPKMMRGNGGDIASLLLTSNILGTYNIARIDHVSYIVLLGNIFVLYVMQKKNGEWHNLAKFSGSANGRSQPRLRTN
jgi:hypothetical protein